MKFYVVAIERGKGTVLGHSGDLFAAYQHAEKAAGKYEYNHQDTDELRWTCRRVFEREKTTTILVVREDLQVVKNAFLVATAVQDAVKVYSSRRD